MSEHSTDGKFFSFRKISGKIRIDFQKFPGGNLGKITQLTTLSVPVCDMLCFYVIG